MKLFVFLSLFSLSAAIRAKYVEDVCFWFSTCVVSHQEKVLKEMNNVKYISHTTIIQKGFLFTTIFYE